MRPQPWNEASTETLHVASAYFVFVAIDDVRPLRAVPPLAPETDGEVRRMREAEIRRAHRLARKQEIEAGRTPARATRGWALLVGVSHPCDACDW